MNKPFLILWTQLPDASLADIIEIDGHRISEEQALLRKQTVTAISKIARSRRRRKLPEGGLLAWSRGSVVGEIPCTEFSDGFRPLVTFAVVGSKTLTLENDHELTARIAPFAETIGYKTQLTPEEEHQITTRIGSFAESVEYKLGVEKITTAVRAAGLVLRPGCFTRWRK